MNNDSEKLIKALEEKLPNGEWKKYVRITADDTNPDLSIYGFGPSVKQETSDKPENRKQMN